MYINKKNVQNKNWIFYLRKKKKQTKKNQMQQQILE